MSIFSKITALFIISLTLMIGIGYQIDTINAQRYESLVLQKYVLDGRKVFRWMATSSANELPEKFKSLNLVTIAKPMTKRVVMQQPHTFGNFEIIQTKENEYVMHVHYIDEDLFLYDTTLQENQQERWILNSLVIVDIIVLSAMFIILLRMLTPLRAIAASMRRFATGEYHSRSDIRSRDEIGEVAHTYNDMAQTIENLILSRQDLLRDVGHELRTPIARGLFALEQIDSSPAQETLKRSLQELNQLTQELLEVEKLQATKKLHTETFSAQTLVLEALSKLLLADESAIKIDIKANFTITGDLKYLALALKNLIDNALKYADKLPITVQIDSNRISVLNHGTALEKDYLHFLTPFTRQDGSRTTPGFGLGLNIVSKIIDKHNFTLDYGYQDEVHRFSIVMHANKINPGS